MVNSILESSTYGFNSKTKNRPRLVDFWFSIPILKLFFETRNWNLDFVSESLIPVKMSIPKLDQPKKLRGVRAVFTSRGGHFFFKITQNELDPNKIAGSIQFQLKFT